MEGVPVIAALSGGVLIGLAATVLLLLDGRIAGISGILGGAYGGKRGDRAWRVAFLAGLASGGWLALIAGLGETAERSGYPLGLLIAAGLLAGFGSRLGSGCTSGHGVCGIARLSPRSMAATLVFTLAGMIVVAGLRLALDLL